MPKIKLSAIVTDIKGKSNGSVFSKNKGGVYFRTNPSGGGRKSAKWGQQKAVFAALSQTWKTLTSEQQDAWNAAVNNYQTTGAFGDIRIPSGYELYMRLNGTLTAQGLPRILEPAMPRELPDFGVLEFNNSDLWQFVPINNASLNNGLILDDSACAAVPITSIFDELLNPFSISCFVDFGLWAYPVAGPQWAYHVFGIKSDTENYLQAVLKVNAGGASVLQIDVYYNGLNNTITTTLTKEELSKPIHICFTQSLFPLGVYKVYINGVQKPIVVRGSGSASATAIDGNLYFGGYAATDPSFNSYSDARFYDTELSADDAALIALGYVLETETLQIPFNSQNAGQFPLYGNASTGLTCEQINIHNFSKIINPYSGGLIPNFNISFTNEMLPNTMLIIRCTPPISAGRNNSNSNLKQVAAFELGESQNFDFYKEYGNLFNCFPVGSELDTTVQILDKTTGVITKAQQVDKKKKPRFKAGTDIADRIN